MKLIPAAAYIVATILGTKMDLSLILIDKTDTCHLKVAQMSSLPAICLQQV